MMASKKLMDLVILEMIQSDEDKKEAGTWSDFDIVSSIRKTGTVILSIIVLCQVVICLVFCFRA